MINELPVEITPKALKEIENIIFQKNIPAGYGLRIGMKGAGCSGMTFMLGFDKEKPNDRRFEMNNVPVFIERRHFMYVLGLQLDFYEGADARGFTFVKADTKT